jgi:hypothetical protein
VLGVAAQSLLTGRAEQAAPGTASAGPFDGLHFRPIGPAAMSGRISDVAVYEANPAIFYVGSINYQRRRTACCMMYTRSGSIPPTRITS